MAYPKVQVTGDLKMRNRIIVNKINFILFGLFIIGILVNLIGYFLLKVDTTIQTVLYCIGGSIIASTLVLFVVLKQLLDLSDIKTLIEKWGLNAIYRTKKEVVKIADKLKKNTEWELDCFIYTPDQVKWLNDKALSKKVSKELRIRILTINPESPVIARLEQDMHLMKGDIRTAILEIEKGLEKLKSQTEKPEFIQCKYYNHIPLDYYLKADTVILTAPYYPAIENDDVLTYEYQRNSLGYEYFKSYFEKLWNNETLCKYDFQEFKQ